jgi:hypothetical protein
MPSALGGSRSAGYGWFRGVDLGDVPQREEDVQLNQGHEVGQEPHQEFGVEIPTVEDESLSNAHFLEEIIIVILFNAREKVKLGAKGRFNGRHPRFCPLSRRGPGKTG